jgi:hypothetical protein
MSFLASLCFATSWDLVPARLPQKLVSQPPAPLQVTKDHYGVSLGRSKRLSGSSDKYREELNDRPVDRARERAIPAAPRRDATASLPGASLLKPIHGILSAVDSRRKLARNI